MQWLEGETLNTFVDRNISTPSRISELIPEFLNLVHRLENLGIAHGDLQHGNILVKQGKLYLIDYDGIFLPELSSLKTNEIGHLNYQHPARSPAHYNSTIDRFSAIVLYLGLQAVSLSQTLWHKYDNSENLLFRADDFANVETSQLLVDISSIPQLAVLTDRFRGVCRLDFEKVPTLDLFLSGNFVYPRVVVPIAAPISVPTRRSQYPVLDASLAGSLLEHIGDRVEIVGLITDHHSARTRHGQPYLFLNFGSYPHQTFTLVLWSTSLAAFNRGGVHPHSLIGKWVKVTGVVGSYQRRPQMTADLPSQVQVLAGEDEARQWLGRAPSKSIQVGVPTRALPEDERVFNTIYKSRKPIPSRPAQRPIPTYQPPSRQTTSSSGCLVTVLGILAFLAAMVFSFIVLFK